ncbi:cysteine desulfurase [Chitinophaga horti]|uniref:cysteine desulfurase n=1 Tax=Chitinophaga horti TaxID=2920382 RepID=A0ABY6JCC4_9BACT|nr:cysteine desulfurase family protein [Chitinophaga horti]UYQ95859.1 cysteine desulfurase [Chitinophaga horti]
MAPVYLDNNATTPCDPRVVEAMLPYFLHQFGNAASADHAYGWQAREAVDDARSQVADLIGASPRQIIFTSGATEAINLALKGLAEQATAGHIITCKTEHKAVLDTCAYLETKGFAVTRLDTDTSGALSPAVLEAAIRPDTVCIALMYANNETGVVHPVKAFAQIARQHDIPFFCDATQAVGKIPVDVEADGIDLLAFSAHKMFGPKGAGVLYVRSKRLGLLPQLHGGQHEGGLRSGTLNTPAIIGLGKAAEIAKQEMATDASRLQALRDQLEQTILQQLPGSKVNGGGERLAHVTNLLLPYPDVEQLLLSLSSQLAVSRGSACAGLVQKPSHVLQAMGLSKTAAAQSVRISLGRFSQQDEVEEAVQHLVNAVRSAVPAM